VSLAAWTMLALAATTAAPDPGEVRFVACPIYRDADAGRKSACWLADDPANARRYDIGVGPTRPDWNYAVLVEGRVAKDAKDLCGGTLLDPVRVSVLPDACPRHMLPAEGYPGRPFQASKRVVAPLSVARKVAQPPYADRAFHLVFDFDKDFIVYQLDDYLMDEAVTWIRQAKPKRIVVTGWAATEPAHVSGVTLAEPASTAKARAQMIAEGLRRLGVDPKITQVRWKTAAQPIDLAETEHLSEPSRRRVDIETFQN
jgi:outer membrane protein OmpA-like peptidoglycan-associated protein